MWKTVKLGDVCEIQPKKAQVKKKLADTDPVSFMPMEDLGIDEMHPAANQTKTLAKAYSSYTYFEDNDVLLAKITPCFENGKLGIASNLENGVGFGSSEYIVLRCGEEVLPQYIYYHLNQPSFRAKGKEQMSGAVGHKRLPKDFVENLEIPLPSLAEQQRIVAKLDAAFAEIDRAVEQVEAKQANAERLKASLLEISFRGDSVIWKTVQLGGLCEILDTRRKPITKKDRIHGEYPYYGATGIVDWVADYIFDEELVLIGEDGAKWDAGEKTAFIVDGKYWVNNHAHVVKPNTEKLLNKWLTYYLCGIDLKPWVTGMTVPKLNQGQLKSIPIPFPPLAEQQRIVAKLDAAFAEIENIFATTSKSKENYSFLKSAILAQELQPSQGEAA